MTPELLPSAPAGPAAEWDAYLPDSAAAFYLCHDWLTSLRGTKGYTDGTWRADGGLVPVYTTDRPIDYRLYDLAYLFGDGDEKAWGRQTLIGSRSGYVNAPMIRDAAALPSWADAAHTAVDAAGCDSAAIAYLDRASVEALAPLFPRAHVLLSGGRSEITFKPGEGYEAFMAGLSRSCRRRIREDLRKFEAGGCTLQVGRLSADRVDTLAPLLANVQHRHGSAVPVERVAAFLNGCTRFGLGERSVLFTGYREGRLIGFHLCFEYGSSLHSRVVGLDYDRIGRHGEYFTLLVHEPARYAINNGLATFDLGTEGYQAKRLRGAELTLQWTLLLRGPLTTEQAAAHNARAVQEWRDTFGDMDLDLGGLA